eukprot:TRINITY_DN12370_c0_g1_i1.p1 TRINITY_DN12370_c0_g1~~TRINITY_DN12370_c0_g1_i1.p1  ORF type:complete len:361 (+),score=66.56 TRINITY_DN12370_c0_g1_i1:116-1198(+)
MKRGSCCADEVDQEVIEVAKRRRVAEGGSPFSECGLSDSQGTASEGSPAREMVVRMVSIGQDGLMGSIPAEYVDLKGFQTNGAFGNMMKAKKKGSDTLYVIKRQSLKDSNTCETAYRELRTLKHITLTSPHPSLIPLHDAWIADNHLYITEPCLEMDITKYIYRMDKWRRGVPVASRQKIIKAILSGLAHLHECNIMHRDFKPENVCVSTDDAGDVTDVKLIDFGSCRRPLEEVHQGAYPPMTYGKYVTTHPYRAPETVVENSHYDFKVDSWSAGCVIAELISGDPLFPCPEEELETAHSSWSPAFLQSRLPKATPEEIRLLSRLLVIDPASRASPSEALDLFGKAEEAHKAVPYFPPRM